MDPEFYAAAQHRHQTDLTKECTPTRTFHTSFGDRRRVPDNNGAHVPSREFPVGGGPWSHRAAVHNEFSHENDPDSALLESSPLSSSARCFLNRALVHA